MDLGKPDAGGYIMSLEDKYNEMVEKKAEEQQKKSAVIEKLKFFEECGLGEARFLFDRWGQDERFTLPTEAADLFKQAVALIKEDKWIEPKILVTPEDAVYVEGQGNTILTRFEKTPIVKIRWQDDCVHLCRFYPVTRSSKLGWFKAESRAKADTPGFVMEINKQRSQLTSWLAGKQRYVILEYKYDYEQFTEPLFLFEDGDLFARSIVSRNDFIIDSYSIRYRYDESGRFLVLKNFLLKNIARINGD